MNSTGGTGHAGGADIGFLSTLNGTTAATENLTLNAGTGGRLRFAGSVGNTKSLGAVTITNAQDLTADAAVSALSLTQTAGSGLTWFKGTVATSGSSGISLSGTNVEFDQAVTTANSGGVTITNSGLLTVLANGDLSLDGAFLQQGGGSVSTAGDILTTGDSVTFTNGGDADRGGAAEHYGRHGQLGRGKHQLSGHAGRDDDGHGEPDAERGHRREAAVCEYRRRHHVAGRGWRSPTPWT